MKTHKVRVEATVVYSHVVDIKANDADEARDMVSDLVHGYSEFIGDDNTGLGELPVFFVDYEDEETTSVLVDNEVTK